MISLKDYLAGGETTISNLLLQNYTKLGLNTNEFMLWLQLYAAHEAGEDFPDLTVIAKSMGSTTEKLYGVLNNLVEKEFVTLETALDESGRQSDRYNLLPAFEKLDVLKEQERFEAEEKDDLAAQKKMLRSFEQEFGRPLSPIEYQKIGYWLNDDQYSPALIELALQEAVLNQAYNFKYIETVLQSWEKKNIRSKAQVEEEQRRRKQILLQKEEQKHSEELPKVSLYNWLERKDPDA
ncbi:DnaD domain protein [Enterococcus hulanensis]|uniref:DnaD domain protein n=1 Tax=Enterococcus hulanensis TaxID=2559929 RepID=A0ABU3EZJ9_9ENTE|nr:MULTISPECIES: DnaD domain protein [Enterococcus]MBO0413754.1 DnaD domain protein [Enterococcus hulanensis]MBX8936715.1 DnaD domain protein [Enterococcus gilvus]MDT2599718.1 DnaD domain protein [Enterococcus hulanensis]MDT2609426.1 DnaD domain protein [Enterococcus hulanensis]MDT2616003.1 DnaD domain protein [Enterococcus hulanensis]